MMGISGVCVAPTGLGVDLRLYLRAYALGYICIAPAGLAIHRRRLLSSVSLLSCAGRQRRKVAVIEQLGAEGGFSGLKGGLLRSK